MSKTRRYFSIVVFIFVDKMDKYNVLTSASRDVCFGNNCKVVKAAALYYFYDKIWQSNDDRVFWKG
jgi:hypothetical protein